MDVDKVAENTSDFELAGNNDISSLARETLVKKVQNLLGLARRAKHLQLGLTAVSKAISCNQAYLVFLASDLAEDSRRKLLNLLLSKTSDKKVCFCCSMFTRAELSLKLDSERAVLSLPSDGFSKAIKDSLLVYSEQFKNDLLEEKVEPCELFNRLQAICRICTGTKILAKQDTHSNSEDNFKRTGKQHKQTKFGHKKVKFARRKK